MDPQEERKGVDWEGKGEEFLEEPEEKGKKGAGVEEEEGGGAEEGGN